MVSHLARPAENDRLARALLDVCRSKVVTAASLVLGVRLDLYLSRRKRMFSHPMAAVRLARRHSISGCLPVFIAIVVLWHAISEHVPIGRLLPLAIAISACGITGWLLAATIWGSYLGARLTAAARGDLPWRLQRFLQDASATGVLQRVGGHYAFRHEKIRATLTATKSPAELRAPTA